jgi:hypothetical protein
MTGEVRSWFGTSVLSVAADPAAQSLATKWLQIKSERDPCLADFWHDPDDALVDHAILLLKGESDYTYLHHGRYLRDRIGFSMQGRMLSELRTRVRTRLLEIYDQSGDGFELAYFETYADFAHHIVLWGRLCMPLRLSQRDPRVMLLLFLHTIEDKASLFKALFERSQVAAIVASPIRDDAGAVVDAWIVAQNEHARPVTGIVEHASATDLLLRGTPLFARDDLWNHLVVGSAPGPTTALVKEPSGATLSVNVEQVGEYLAIRMTPLDHGAMSFTLDQSP